MPRISSPPYTNASNKHDSAVVVLKFHHSTSTLLRKGRQFRAETSQRFSRRHVNELDNLLRGRKS